MDDEKIKISEIEYDGKKYIKKLNTEENEIKYEYYYLENGIEKELEDEKILEYLRNTYESHENDIVYDR